MAQGMTTIMTTPTGRRMITDRLTLAQWLSPSFPLGSFAYSHGLEHAVTAGDVHDAETLAEWLRIVLHHGAGRVDAVLLCLALRGEDMGETARALAGSRERLEETEAQGRAFADTVARMQGRAVPAHPLPVAVGMAAQDLDLPAQEVAALYLHAFASNIVSAGVRFIPLGQSQGQQVLAGLHQGIAEIAEWAATAGLADLRSGAFGADLAAMQHETQHVRIFKT